MTHLRGATCQPNVALRKVLGTPSGRYWALLPVYDAGCWLLTLGVVGL